MSNRFVIGIDGGGTHTRVIAVDESGNVLAYVEAGSARPDRDASAQDNVRGAIVSTVTKAGRSLGDLACIVAGLAGLDRPEDHVWADQLTAVPDLSCPRIHLNDAVVAHSGALLGRPGIIAISGTGSILFGVTEDGERLRNYDMSHYAATAARHLAYEMLYRIIGEVVSEEDSAFVQEVAAHFGRRDAASLHTVLTGKDEMSDQDRFYLLSSLAPIITGSAESGVPIAKAVCEAAAEELAIGIRLVGSFFAQEQVQVALIGSVIRSPYIQRALGKRLAVSMGRHQYVVTRPQLSSAAGAALMALKQCGASLESEGTARLASHPASVVSD